MSVRFTLYGLSNVRGVFLRSDWCSSEDMQHVLAALMPENRLVMEIALHTGLRISDIVAFKTDKLSQRMSVRERKTGKVRRIYLPKGLLARLRAVAGPIWVFSGAYDEARHRTRQAVWADVKRAAKLFRLRANVTPHSARKIYAVEKFHTKYDLDRVRHLLNHDNDAVTLLYAMADQISARRGVSPRKRAAASRPA